MDSGKKVFELDNRYCSIINKKEQPLKPKGKNKGKKTKNQGTSKQDSVADDTINTRLNE